MYTENLGEIIHIYRKRKGLTQAQLAKLLGISKSTLCNYESGKTVPHAQMLIQLSELLEVPLKLFLQSNIPAVPNQRGPKKLHEYYHEYDLNSYTFFKNLINQFETNDNADTEIIPISQINRFF